MDSLLLGAEVAIFVVALVREAERGSSVASRCRSAGPRHRGLQHHWSSRAAGSRMCISLRWSRASSTAPIIRRRPIYKRPTGTSPFGRVAGAARRTGTRPPRGPQCRSGPAEAEERAAHDRQARSAAEAAEHDANDANAAWERVEALEVELAAATDQVGSLTEALGAQSQQHASQLEALGLSHSAELSTARADYEEGLAEAASVTCTAEVGRLAAHMDELRSELGDIRSEAGGWPVERGQGVDAEADGIGLGLVGLSRTDGTGRAELVTDEDGG
jgi:hypothetical protein